MPICLSSAGILGIVQWKIPAVKPGIYIWSNQSILAWIRRSNLEFELVILCGLSHSLILHCTNVVRSNSTSDRTLLSQFRGTDQLLHLGCHERAKLLINISALWKCWKLLKWYHNDLCYLKEHNLICLPNKIRLNLINTFVMSRNKHISKKTPCFLRKRSKNKAKPNEFERRILKLSCYACSDNPKCWHVLVRSWAHFR